VRKITLYRDDSTTQVVYENVKHIFWLADNTVMCIAQYTEPGLSDDHRYINWLREHFVWYRDEPQTVLSDSPVAEKWRATVEERQ